MCGRFAGYRPVEVLREYFPIDHTAADVTTNDNAARSDRPAGMDPLFDQPPNPSAG